MEPPLRLRELSQANFAIGAVKLAEGDSAGYFESMRRACQSFGSVILEQKYLLAKHIVSRHDANTSAGP